LRSRFSRDYAFWLYLFGVLTFWSGLSLMDSGSEWGKLIYCGINVAMILVGAVLGRRVFAVFGGLGVAGYLGYLSYRVFKDSLIFPFALSAVGLAIIALGVLWQRREVHGPRACAASSPALRERSRRARRNDSRYGEGVDASLRRRLARLIRTKKASPVEVTGGTLPPSG
jgi:hypothetical protein